MVDNNTIGSTISMVLLVLSLLFAAVVKIIEIKK